MQLDVPATFVEVITKACHKSGINEVGGMLFGEYLGPGHFRLAEVTVDEPGFVASFKRSINHAVGACKKFFGKTRHDYARFNYLGEWHSHPSYAVHPSSTDDQSMFHIVRDPNVGANFAVLSIVRLDGDLLTMKAWAYFPDGERIEFTILSEP
jgi:proteasome lid subunit RPN8/RPN11